MSASDHQTSRDYAHPHRPWLLRAVNGVGRGLRKLGAGNRLEVDDLLARARRKSKLERLDDEGVLDRLAHYVDALEREAELSPGGRLMTRAHLVAVLVTQLRTRAWRESNPEIFAAPLPRQIFITGLARSGTTHLQRMLAELPGARPLITWEALEPIPEPSWRRPSDPLADPRVARAHQAGKFLQAISPDFFVVHPMAALVPEEEVMVMEHSLLSWVPETTYHVPSFGTWYEQQDQTPGYRWLDTALRHLTWQRPGDFWLLKAPHHLAWLDVLFAVFPDAKVIHCHRDPAQTVPSFCSLVAHGWGIMSDHVDPLALGKIWSEKLARMTDRALEVRAARSDAGMIDVDYRELVADPLAVMTRLCGELELAWDPEIRDRIGRWLADNTQHKHGLHRYEAGDFGLDEAGMHERFAAYRRRFGL
ncbi:sulfotransferase family protein [Nannocystaceae bacterium ST9]